MNFRKTTSAFVLTVMAALFLTACTAKISFSGASIPAAAQTFSVSAFPNNAPMVAPSLSSTMYDMLLERMERQTRLSQTREEGDLSFSGEITGYSTAPSMIGGSGTQEGATMNRLTITVKVQFVNTIEPQYNFNKSFSAHEDYPVSETLMQAEDRLIPLIVETLVNDIFNAAVANW